MFLFSFVSRYFLISSLISSVTHWFLGSMLFRLHLLVLFAVFFLEWFLCCYLLLLIKKWIFGNLQFKSSYHDERNKFQTTICQRWNKKNHWGQMELEDEVVLSIVKVKVAQLCLTLCNPMGCTVHGILQARILEWVAFPFSRGSSQPRGRTQVSCIIAGRFFTSWATREAQEYWSE